MTRAFGLTGGIGMGKSAVADLLAGYGAILVDADKIAREVVAPGAPAYAPVLERFGREILAADGTIDRPALAAMVFADPVALADLNSITHPVIGSAMAEELATCRAGAGSDERVVIVVIPLLRAAHVEELELSAVVVVDCPTEVAVQRVVTARGMDEMAVRARVAAQPSREARLALADYVVDNSGSREDLLVQVDALWAWIGRWRGRG